MDDEEDDVFKHATQYCCNFTREIKQEERGTQTPGRLLPRPNGMLPCGVAEEPRRLFYGSAGLLLLAPPAHPDRADGAMLPENQLAVEARARPAHSVEASIGQKLQMIGDQFYQDHMLQHRNQRQHGPLWLRLASALYTLLFDREPAAEWRGVDQR